MKYQRLLLGSLAIIFYATHATTWLLRGFPENLLWACHVGALLVGIGWLISNARVLGIGFLWLCMGNFFWFLYLATGGEFIITSALTHVGGLLIAIAGIRKYSMPRYTWLWAIIALALLQQITRFATPPNENVNLAFAVQQGWETMFPSYTGYMIMMFSTNTLSFMLIEWITRKITKR